MPQADESARTLRRFRAPEASQAVAVDRRFFYAIGNTVVAKSDKNTGAPVATWRAEAGSHIAHLNSGIVVGRELFCAHSNYPETPMVSSIEVFDTGRMTHRRSIPLTGEFGSATWIDRADGGWWVTFAHYAGKGGLPGKGPDATRLVRFSTDWKVRRVYAFPAAVVSRWEMMSSSGGIAVTPRVFATTGTIGRSCISWSCRRPVTNWCSAPSSRSNPADRVFRSTAPAGRSTPYSGAPVKCWCPRCRGHCGRDVESRGPATADVTLHSCPRRLRRAAAFGRHDETTRRRQRR